MQSIVDGQYNCAPLNSNPPLSFNGTCPPNSYIIGYSNNGFQCAPYPQNISVNNNCPVGYYVRGVQNGIVTCNPFQTTYPLCTPGSQRHCVNYTTGGIGTQVCNVNGDAYGACGNYTACLPGYTFSNGACTPTNTCQAGLVCPITNGVGQTACNGNSQSCQLVYCYNGYEASGNSCVLSCPTGFAQQNNQCVDVTPPILEWVIRPNTVVNGNSSWTSYQYRVYDAETGVRLVECSVDGGAYQSCHSSLLDGLPVGQHSLTIRAYDHANNMATISETWTKGACSPGSITQYQIDFGTCSKTCTASGVYPQSCTDIQCWTGYSEVNGQCRDLTGPVITWITHPPSTTNANHYSIYYTVTDVSRIASIMCSLDNSGFTDCDSIRFLNGVQPGNHTFKVKASDVHGNTTIESVSWTQTQ